MTKNYNISLLNRNWESTILDRRFTMAVPKKPGIYKIFSGKGRYMKIPLGLQIHYVGKASRSIRSRFLDHTGSREHNNDLAKLASNSQLEFWFLELSPNEVDAAEIEAIKYYYSNNRENLLNKITYKGK